MKKKPSEHAMAAREIRKILKDTHPEIKFSVTSKQYSGGTSINVTWTDGPERRQIMSLINHFEYGRFNMMTDCYEMTNVRDDIPQVKWVSCSRTETYDDSVQ